MKPLICPRCGGVLKWVCPEDEGEAVCSAFQSRDGSGDAGPDCTFVGKVRRVSPSEVAMSTFGQFRGYSAGRVTSKIRGQPSYGVPSGPIIIALPLRKSRSSLQ